MRARFARGAPAAGQVACIFRFRLARFASLRIHNRSRLIQTALFFTWVRRRVIGIPLFRLARFACIPISNGPFGVHTALFFAARRRVIRIWSLTHARFEDAADEHDADRSHAHSAKAGNWHQIGALSPAAVVSHTLTNTVG